MPPRIRVKLKSPAEERGGMYFSSPKENIRFIPSGCTMLDLVLGGGWALGRVSNLVGDRSSGKTLLAMEAIANFLTTYPGAAIRYNEAESAFDADYAKALGIPMDSVDMREDCQTVEEFQKDAEEFAANCVEAGVPGLYILDSLDALSDAAEMDRDVDKGSYGAAKAKKLSEFFRRNTQRLKRADVHLLIISQTRDKIGVTFGEKHSRSGGRALDFYASQIVWLAHIETIKKTIAKVTRPVGVTIKAKCKKNKVALPFRECQFQITFGYGVEDEQATQDWLKTIGASGASLEGEALREAATSKWYAIEKTFLPERTKYGQK